MSPRLPLLLALAVASLFAGCATYSDAELAQFRQRGLRPALIYKLEHRRPLLPDDIIELNRAHVSDRLILRHLDHAGVNYLVTRADVLRLRRARVSATVVDALLRESDRFAYRVTEPPVYDDFYYDPFYAPYYGGWSLGFSHYSGHRFGHRHHRHH